MKQVNTELVFIRDGGMHDADHRVHVPACQSICLSPDLNLLNNNNASHYDRK